MKEPPPDVSVIIAAYNVEAYIARAVRSALAQAGVTLEVIVVDDGSTDATWAIVAALDDPRLKPMRLPQNSGPGAARNAGIAMAAGAWIAVLDGDDTMAPNRLARCLQRARDRKAVIVADNLLVCREGDGASSPMFKPEQFKRWGTLDLARFIAGNRSFLGGAALGYLKPVFSAAFLRKHNLTYNPALRVGEDYMLLAEALANGASCVLEPTPGYLYTARAASTSHRLSTEDLERIAEGDKRFLTRYVLSPAAAKAQRRRKLRLDEARVFTLFVDALKRRDTRCAFYIVLLRPTVPWRLWRAAAKRLGRVVGLRSP